MGATNAARNMFLGGQLTEVLGPSAKFCGVTSQVFWATNRGFLVHLQRFFGPSTEVSWDTNRGSILGATNRGFRDLRDNSNTHDIYYKRASDRGFWATNRGFGATNRLFLGPLTEVLGH